MYTVLRMEYASKRAYDAGGTPTQLGVVREGLTVTMAAYLADTLEGVRHQYQAETPTCALRCTKVSKLQGCSVATALRWTEAHT